MTMNFNEDLNDMPGPSTMKDLTQAPSSPPRRRKQTQQQRTPPQQKSQRGDRSTASSCEVSNSSSCRTPTNPTKGLRRLTISTRSSTGSSSLRSPAGSDGTSPSPASQPRQQVFGAPNSGGSSSNRQLRMRKYPGTEGHPDPPALHRRSKKPPPRHHSPDVSSRTRKSSASGSCSRESRVSPRPPPSRPSTATKQPQRKSTKTTVDSSMPASPTKTQLQTNVTTAAAPETPMTVRSGTGITILSSPSVETPKQTNKINNRRRRRISRPRHRQKQQQSPADSGNLSSNYVGSPVESSPQRPNAVLPMVPETPIRQTESSKPRKLVRKVRKVKRNTKMAAAHPKPEQQHSSSEMTWKRNRAPETQQQQQQHSSSEMTWKRNRAPPTQQSPRPRNKSAPTRSAKRPQQPHVKRRMQRSNTDETPKTIGKEPTFEAEWPETPSIANTMSAAIGSPSRLIANRFVQVSKPDEFEAKQLVVMHDEDDKEQRQQQTKKGGIRRTVAAASSTATRLYDYARHCEWDKVLEECRENPRDASYVSEKDGTTALHLAVMSRSNPVMRRGGFEGCQPAPRLVVEALLVACPEAAITRCTVKRYTPLTYACLVADDSYDMNDAADMIVTILRQSPHSAYVFTDDGFSALDVHILSYSRIQRRRGETYAGDPTSTVVLQTLLSEKPFLAEARTYGNRVRGPLELLYRSNMEELKTAADGKDEIGRAIMGEWWAWKWTCLLLEHGSPKLKLRKRRFSAVQEAAQLVGCPSPVLSLAIGMKPNHVSARDPTNDIYNLPLHDVAAWRIDGEMIAGDPFIIRRKARAIDLLLEEYPEAARSTNNMGETALQLAIESGTPWNGGVEALVEACPKALKFPRRLRKQTDTNKNSLSVSYHSKEDNDDDDDDDSDSECYVDPAAPIEGMYPFLVAAALARVSSAKKRDQQSVLHHPEQQQIPNKKDQLKQDLAKRDLESLRVIYGLLRSRPDALAMYADDVKQKTAEGWSTRLMRYGK